MVNKFVRLTALCTFRLEPFSFAPTAKCKMNAGVFSHCALTAPVIKPFIAKKTEPACVRVRVDRFVAGQAGTPTGRKGISWTNLNICELSAM